LLVDANLDDSDLSVSVEHGESING